MTNPYYYRIKDKTTGIYYVGCRYSEGCDPKEFWVSYFTSSKIIWKLIEESGPERFEVQKVIPKKNSYSFETKILQKVDAKNNPSFYNKHNNDFENGFGLESYLKYMSEKYGVEHPSKVPEIKEKMVSKMKKTRNSEEWKNSKGNQWSENISKTLKDRSNRKDWDKIDEERRNKISKWVNDSDNQQKRLLTLRNTLQTDYYQSEVEPKRVEKIIQSQKKDGLRKEVLEIRELKDNLHHLLKKRMIIELGIKPGWYRKKDEELHIMLVKIKKWIEENE